MKHPDDERWVSWIFGEAGRQEAQELAAHRAICPDCDRRIRLWEGTLRRLDHEPVSAGRRSRFGDFSVWPAARWAAAAAVLLVGLLTGWTSRSVSSAAEAARLSRELQAGWAQELDALRSEMRADAAAQIQQVRAADSVEFLAALKDLQASHTAQIAALREDLEVMAFNTQATLQVAEQKLVQLSLDPRPGEILSP
ncbi:MAG: hypothetical protein JNN07_10560 [Verrucomicrobiales bacterium]|nr:hypothetical protein [Verrucomicrobiales bacterium]